jgi:hypothetical protein
LKDPRSFFSWMISKIDQDLLGRGEKPVIMYEIVSDESQIPKNRGGKTYIITAIPEPDPLPEELRKNDT